MELTAIEEMLIENYTNAYPSEDKQIDVLLEASNNNELTLNVIDFLLNDEDNYELIQILDSYRNDVVNNIDF